MLTANPWHPREDGLEVCSGWRTPCTCQICGMKRWLVGIMQGGYIDSQRAWDQDRREVNRINGSRRRGL